MTGTFNFLSSNSEWVGKNVPLMTRIISGRKSEENMPELCLKSTDLRVNLNIHNKADLLSGSINMRVFEVAGTGSFLLTDGNATKYFDKTSIGTFNDADDLSTKIRFYLEHEQIREDMAAKSREICYKYHTYDIRVESILKFIMY